MSYGAERIDRSNTIPQSTQQTTPPPTTAQSSGAAEQEILAELGLVRDPQGNWSFPDVSVDEASAAQAPRGQGEAAKLSGSTQTALPPPRAPEIAPLTAEEAVAAEGLIIDTQELMGEAVAAMSDPQRDYGLTGDLGLLMLKLRIGSALNDPETLNALLEANDELADMEQETFAYRQEEQQKALKQAEKLRKKAEKAQRWGKILKVASYVVAAVATVVTAGTAGPATLLMCMAVGALVGAGIAKATGKDVASGAYMGAMAGLMVAGFIGGGAAVAAQTFGERLAAAAPGAALGAAAAGTEGCAGYKMGEHAGAMADSEDQRLSAEMIQHFIKMVQSQNEEVTKYIQMILKAVNEAFEQGLERVKQDGAVKTQMIAAAGSTAG